MRYEETLIALMRQSGLLVTEAIEEQIYAEVFNSAPGQRFDPTELFDLCKSRVSGSVEAETKPKIGEIE